MGHEAYAIRKGWLYDPECHRTTYRRQLAASFLREQGAFTEREHADDCGRKPERLRNVVAAYRERVCCTCGRDRDPFEWAEWVDDEVIGAAYRLADQIQTKRGDYNRGEAARLKAEQRKGAAA